MEATPRVLCDPGIPVPGIRFFQGKPKKRNNGLFGGCQLQIRDRPLERSIFSVVQWLPFFSLFLVAAPLQIRSSQKRVPIRSFPGPLKPLSMGTKTRRLGSARPPGRALPLASDVFIFPRWPRRPRCCRGIGTSPTSSLARC